MPIRWRLTLFIALVIGAILLLLGFSLYFLLREALLSNVEDIAQSRAFSAARAVESEGELDEVEQFTLDAVVVIVRDADGHILQTVNLPAERGAHDVVWRQALGSGEPASGTARFAGGDPYYVHAVLVAPSEGRARVVEAGRSYEFAEETLEVFRTVLAVGIGAAFLLSIGGSYLLARAALRPVEAVASAAREMGEGDLSKRLPVANPRDEVGRLTTTINGLLSRLQAAFARREETLQR